MEVRVDTHNEFDGSAANVVQARDVHGNLHVHHTPATRLPVPRQLPMDVVHFTGRGDHLDALDAQLTNRTGNRGRALISTIAGLAGVGKTALALHWSHKVKDRFPDGQLYVNLRGFDPGPPIKPETVVESFLRALDVPAEKVPVGAEEQVALFRSLTSGRRYLLLLDNARNSKQVRSLLPASPDCMVVVTSRNCLSGLVAREGATRITLDLMDLADALALLGKVIGQSRVDAEMAPATALVERCGSLPLALRIAAERIVARPHLAMAELVAELGVDPQRLDALAVSDDDETLTVRNVFSWSYRSLVEEDARLFRSLGLHAGGDFSDHAAAAMVGVPVAEARRTLDRLVGLHLLEERSRNRYQFHDLLRLYAADRGEAEDGPASRARTEGRMLSWYLYTADAAARGLSPERELLPLPPVRPDVRPLRFTCRKSALHWFEAERGNLMACVRRAASGEHWIAWRLALAVRGFLTLRKYLADAVEVSRTGRAAAQHLGDRRGEAEMLTMRGHVLNNLRRYEEALKATHRSLTLWQELQDQSERRRR